MPQHTSPIPEEASAPDVSGLSLATDLHAGLDTDEVARRQIQFGPNALHEEHTNPLVKFLSYFWGPIPWMIGAAALLSAAVRHWEDFAIIMIMLLLNAGVGFWEEFKADNAIAALKKTLALKAYVLRDGIWARIAARDLVPGDVISLRLGNIVPADVKLAQGAYLSVDQSALTGESLPVDKSVGDIAYSSSIARMGEMTAIVTAIGEETYFGRTAKLVAGAGTTSHFQTAVLKIGNFLILTTLGMVSLILIVALFRHDPLIETVQFALILTVAAIPVALPAVLSVTMAVGAVTLARMKAIVSRLVSIEELAGMDILCSDKTGTLTKNELLLGTPVALAARDAQDVVLAAALASERENPDAIDQAIIRGLKDSAALSDYEVRAFTPFDPVAKRAEAEVTGKNGPFRVAKGAPQAIADLTGADPALRTRITAEIDAMADKGYRTLGVARADPQKAWSYLGLLALSDPPRDDARQTIHETQEMGLEVRMVTGDHAAIAREIAGQLGLGTNIVAASEAFGADAARSANARIEAADGFAQVFPEHKFKIVQALQAGGHIVGMTGDGVNDAPALKQADVGIAVSGATDAARAAADLILTDVGLGVITGAIEQSRKIFERMNNYAVFRIAETIRVLLFMTLSILVFNFYPVTAAMIVLLAILNDFPIMMIAYDNAPVAKRPVRWNMHRVLTLSVVLGVVGVVETFLLFWFVDAYLAIPRDVIQTIIFLKLLVAGHLTLYVARSDGWFWERPWPNWKLFATTEGTQIIGTLAAVYGWAGAAIGWKYALAVWGYALLWIPIENAAKVFVHRLIRHRVAAQARHIERIETPLHR